MSEHTDLLPLRSPEEGGPAFELVRRGYDREQVENHLGWLEDQLRNTEIARDAAEHAAAAAAAEAEAAREALESGRPLWHELGDRVTQILTLAEDQGAEIRAQRTAEAEQLLADARQVAVDADRIHGSRIREAQETAAKLESDAAASAAATIADAQALADQTIADADNHAQMLGASSRDKAEHLVADAQAKATQLVGDAQATASELVGDAQAKAEQLVSNAQSEADRILVRSQQQAAEEERASSRKLADLERQRDAVNAQLTRLHETLASALAPAISMLQPEPSVPVVSVADEPDDAAYEDEDYAAATAAKTTRSQNGRSRS
jgi:cell division septum initiation protein DivIVA